MKTLKLQTLGNLCYISSHSLEAVDNYKKEKVITTNKVTPNTGINKTAKTSPLFQYQRQYIYIYLYIK